MSMDGGSELKACPFCGWKPDGYLSGEPNGARPMLHHPERNNCALSNLWFRVDRWNTRTESETPTPGLTDDVVKELVPPELAERLLAIGEVEWGATDPQPDAEHLADLQRSLDETHAYFETAEPTAMHGLYMKGKEIAVCITGMSPNSGDHARLLAGAWNYLVALARTGVTLNG